MTIINIYSIPVTPCIYRKGRIPWPMISTIFTIVSLAFQIVLTITNISSKY